MIGLRSISTGTPGQTRPTTSAKSWSGPWAPAGARSISRARCYLASIMAEAAGLVLGLDTSTAVVVGLARSGTVLTTAVLHDTMAHVEQVIPLVREICREAQVTPAQIDRIVVGLGPGP